MPYQAFNAFTNWYEACLLMYITHTSPGSIENHLASLNEACSEIEAAYGHIGSTEEEYDMRYLHPFDHYNWIYDCRLSQFINKPKSFI